MGCVLPSSRYWIISHLPALRTEVEYGLTLISWTCLSSCKCHSIITTLWTFSVHLCNNKARGFRRNSRFQSARDKFEKMMLNIIINGNCIFESEKEWYYLWPREVFRCETRCLCFYPVKHDSWVNFNTIKLYIIKTNGSNYQSDLHPA